MMVSEVPQIDVSSLSRQQLQHLLETSRRMGRTEMADAVAHEMRERRAQPETSRSWVEVEFSEVAAEAGLEPGPEAEVEPQRVADVVAETSDEIRPASPRQDVAAAGPADPYAFSAIRAVPDDTLRVSAPAPRTTAPRARAPLARRRARLAGPRGGRGVVLGAVAVGAAALAAVAAMVPLQQLQIRPAATTSAPSPVAHAALAPPQAATPDVLASPPAPRAAMALTLRGPITSPAEPPALAAPSPTTTPSPTAAPTPSPRREFTIPAADLKAAADRANQLDRAKARAEDLQGTWFSPEFAPARCRWSRPDPTLAVCQTRTRYEASRPWRERTGHYRRDADGVWQVAP